MTRRDTLGTMPKLKQENTMKHINITKEQAAEIVRGTNGKFFTVAFVKKDGSDRVITGRTGVKYDLKGGVNTCAHIQSDMGGAKYLNVFGVKERERRNVNVDTIKWIHTKQTMYHVEG